MSQSKRLVAAALAALIVLQLVMLAALLAGAPPHPPARISLFAIAPFLSASLAAAAAALALGPEGRAGLAATLFAAFAAMLSYGPQKYLDPQLPLIWPAVVAAQVAVVTLVAALPAARRGGAHG